MFCKFDVIGSALNVLNCFNCRHMVSLGHNGLKITKDILPSAVGSGLPREFMVHIWWPGDLVSKSTEIKANCICRSSWSFVLMHWPGTPWKPLYLQWQMKIISKWSLRYLEKIICILVGNSLYFVSKGPIDYKPALVEVMAWRQTADKLVPESMMTQFTNLNWLRSSDAYMRCQSNQHWFI